MVSDSSFISKLLPTVANAHPTLSSSNQTEEIWSKILQEVSTKNSGATQGSVIFLGDEQCGKSSLVYRMTNSERQNYSSVLEYNYLTVHADPDGSYAYQLGSGTGLGLSDYVNLPLWILDCKDELAPLLKFSFPSQLTKCVVVLCASLEQPGNIMPSLNKWYSIVEEQIRLFYSREEVDQAKQAQVRFWQEYVEPVESSMHVENSTNRLEIDPVLLPPEQGVLDYNCGATIIVAITKSDLNMEVGADIDKVQYHVRQFCIQHGATLVYTSAKEEKNTQLLYKYLAHRVFSLPFTHPAYIVENDSIFVPSGWDSEQKLDIIKETLTDLEVPIIPQEDLFLNRENYRNDQIIESEDEQAFLQRLYSSLSDGTSSGGSGVGGVGSGSGGGGTGTSPKRNDIPVTTLNTNKSQMNITHAAGDSNTLASFFNSLLLRKDNAGLSNIKSSNSNNSDADDNLNRIIGKPQANSTPNQKSILPLNEEVETDLLSGGSASTPRDGNENN